jgi:hypothetical protein
MIRFPQENGTSVALETMIAHAEEIRRSDPAVFYDLIKFPEMREAAVTLLAAHRMGAPEADVITHAAHLDSVLREVRNAKAVPKPSKPTIGKASDRVGEKARKEAAKAKLRDEKRALIDQSNARTLPLFGGHL